MGSKTNIGYEGLKVNWFRFQYAWTGGGGHCGRPFCPDSYIMTRPVMIYSAVFAPGVLLPNYLQLRPGFEASKTLPTDPAENGHPKKRNRADSIGPWGDRWANHSDHGADGVSSHLWVWPPAPARPSTRISVRTAIYVAHNNTYRGRWHSNGLQRPAAEHFTGAVFWLTISTSSALSRW